MIVTADKARTTSAIFGIVTPDDCIKFILIDYGTLTYTVAHKQLFLRTCFKIAARKAANIFGTKNRMYLKNLK